MNEYFASRDKKLFINLRRGKGYAGELEKINRDDSELTVTITLKAALTIKMILRITGYYQGAYLYTLSNKGLIMNYTEYGVNKANSIALAG